MRLLLDTHILLWAASDSERLSVFARSILEDVRNDLVFSAVNLWEIAIKSGLGRNDFQVDGSTLRRALLHNGYTELAVSGVHALAVENLPSVHRDPFDRMLVAQTQVEMMTLVTSDPLVAQYPGSIKHV